MTSLFCRIQYKKGLTFHVFGGLEGKIFDLEVETP